MVLFMSMKQKIAELFGICTYEEENERLNGMVSSLADQAAAYKVKAETLAEEVEYYKNQEDVKELADNYIRQIQIYQEVSANCNAMIDDVNDKTKRAYNHGFSDGRMAAYSEMGIWRLDAIEAGNRLVMDAKGDVYELLELQDVKPEDTGMVTDDGIIIDDLTDIGA